MHEEQPMNNNTILLKRLNQSNFQMLQQQQIQEPPPSLKCPRCDSINTKFCYYNNYNLSQPRHFCKNCRRYWTKGGVLRNVPVGGGCRKSKRSSSSTSSNKIHKSSSTSLRSVRTVTGTVNNSGNGQNSNSHSSSDSSTALFQIVPQVENLGIGEGLFSGGEIEGFMNLITQNDDNKNSVISNNNDDNSNEIGNDVFSEYLQSEGIQDWDMGKICGGVHGGEKMVGVVDLVNPTDRIEDLLQSRGSNVGLTTLDWHLTAGNDPHQGYWGQSTVESHDHDHDHDSQWCDSTTSHLPLFLP